MSLTFPIRSNIGAASAGTLASPGISSSVGSGYVFSVTGLTNFFDVATGATPSASSQIVLAVDYGTANAEKILCTYSSGSFTIVTRNYDSTSTSIPTHATGASVIPVFSANEAAEHNAAAQSLKHVLTGGFGAVTSSAGTVSVGGTGSLGTAPVAAHMDHTRALPTSALSSWISTPATVPGSSITGAIAPAATMDASQLTGTLTATQLTNAAATASATPQTSGAITTSAASVVSTTLSGYTTYLVTFNLTASMGSTAHNIVASIGVDGTNIPSTAMIQGIPVSSTASVSVTYIATSLSTASHTFNGFVYSGGTGGNVVNATLSVVGLA